MMQGRFAVNSSKCNIYRIPNSTNITFISLISKRQIISYNINQHICGQRIILACMFESKKKNFNLYFVNYDISINITLRNTIRKESIEKITKIFPFLT